MITMFGERKKKSFFGDFSGIAGICSSAITTISLAYNGILSVEWSAFIMIAVVIMAAVGNVATKLGICAVAIFLFAKYVSRGNDVQFQQILGAILALLIALIGLYIMLRGFFIKY